MDTLSLFSPIEYPDVEEEKLWIQYEGDWLPITWIPATEAELRYMDKVREREKERIGKYIQSLKEKY